MRSRLGAGLGVLIVMAAGPSGATTWNVPGDAPSIAAAVDSAAAGDTVLVACGTYAEHDIVLPRAVTLRSATGDPDCVTIDAQSLGRVILADEPGGPVTIEGITVTGGLVAGATPTGGWGGGMLFIAAAPELARCRFEGNRASAGGGLAIAGHGTTTVTDCEFLGNSAEYGAGSLVWVGDADFSRCSFAGGSADSSGGGIHVTLATVDCSRVTFSDNAATLSGSAISADIQSLLDVSGSILAYGTGDEPVAADSTSAVTVDCTDVFGNSGGDWIGPLAPWDGVAGNFAADPLFCDRVGYDFHLGAASPCLPGQHPTGAACDTIGAFGPADCSGVAAPEIGPAPAALRLAARPNPFPERTEIRWSGPRVAIDRLTIHDVTGRVVRTLGAPGTAAGSGVVAWDGRDDRGRAVAAGVYWVRLRAAGTTAAHRLVLRR